MQQNNIHSQDVLWCLSQSDAVHWAEWEDTDESVIYIESTGQTALVSLLSISLLEALTDKTQNLANLIDNISEFLVGDTTQTELESAIQASLAQLQQFGVIEPCKN